VASRGLHAANSGQYELSMWCFFIRRPFKVDIFSF
jgi:hypothetical protein